MREDKFSPEEPKPDLIPSREHTHLGKVALVDLDDNGNLDVSRYSRAQLLALIARATSVLIAMELGEAMR